jgi:hypothetical protein
MCPRHREYGFRLRFRLNFEDGPPSSYSSPELAVAVVDIYTRDIYIHTHTDTHLFYTLII